MISMLSNNDHRIAETSPFEWISVAASLMILV